MTAGDNAQRVVPVALPVLAGVGAVLHEIVMVDGQVMVTCPCINTKGPKASHTERTHQATFRLKCAPWGLEPG